MDHEYRLLAKGLAPANATRIDALASLLEEKGIATKDDIRRAEDAAEARWKASVKEAEERMFKAQALLWSCISKLEKKPESPAQELFRRFAELAYLRIANSEEMFGLVGDSGLESGLGRFFSV
jgi:TPP-dependent pyruvate/acetoin dehydrogenase alpha subunit